MEGAEPPRWQTVSANVCVDDTLSAGIRTGGPLVHSRAILLGLHGTLGWHGVPVLGLGDAGQVWILLCACHQATSWSVSLSSSICGRRQLRPLQLRAHCLGLTLTPQFESSSDANSVALANLIFWASRFPACKMKLLQHLNHGAVVRVS